MAEDFKNIEEVFRESLSDHELHSGINNFGQIISATNKKLFFKFIPQKFNIFYTAAIVTTTSVTVPVVVHNLNNNKEIETPVKSNSAIDALPASDTLDLTKDFKLMNTDTFTNDNSQPIKNNINKPQPTDYQHTNNSEIIEQDTHESPAEPIPTNNISSSSKKKETPQSLPIQVDSSKIIDTFVVSKSLILEEQEIKVKTKKVKKKR